MPMMNRIRRLVGSFRAWLEARWKWPALSAVLTAWGWVAFNSIEVAGLIVMAVPAVDVVLRRSREHFDGSSAEELLPALDGRHHNGNALWEGSDGRVGADPLQHGTAPHADAAPTPLVSSPTASHGTREDDGRSEIDWQHVASSAGATVAVVAAGYAFAKLPAREQRALLIGLLVAIALAAIWVHLGARSPETL